MNWGLIADVHANLEALGAVLKFLSGRTDRLVVLGDVVGYGPDPEACCAALSGASALFVRGNHEDGLVTGDYHAFKPDAATALAWTAGRLPPETVARFRDWPDRIREEGFLFVHGSPADPLAGYINSAARALSAFGAFDTGVCFHGHTHFPGAYRCGPDGKPALVPADFSGTLTVKIEPGSRYLVNVGSVGQPRDGIPAAAAGIYDPDKRLFRLHRVPYPAEVTRDKILAAGLPSSLASRLIHGL